MILIVVSICFVIFSIWFYSKHPLSTTITIKQTEFIVDLAITPQEKTKGLSFRKNLPSKHGMLFVYENKDKYPFWMKDMHFPLDFIWIDGNTVVDITKNVPPANLTSMQIVKPIEPVNKILEINAGEIDKYNIQVGDTVLFN